MNTETKIFTAYFIDLQSIHTIMLYLHVHRAAEQSVQYKTPLGRKYMFEQHFRAIHEFQTRNSTKHYTIENA